MRYLFISILFLMPLFYQSCATFKPLPNTVDDSEKIIGIYSNDCDSTSGDIYYKPKLWNIIDKKYKDQQKNYFVKFELTKENNLKAQLINRDIIITEKIIKGKFKNDLCYYKRRLFYIVPILPVLWWFNNEQIRFYYSDNHLVLDKTYNTGGAIIIMASGNKGNVKWFYRKIQL